MADLLVRKRRFHTFLSHAHVDKPRADALYDWLRNTAGVPVWYDAAEMPSGATIAQMLPQAIESSRSLMLLMSKESITRGWVEHEYNAAINHQTQHPGFRIIPVRLDDVQAKGLLGNYSAVDLPAGGVDIAAAAGILRGMYQPATSIDPLNGKNVYVSRGWHRNDGDRAEQVCAALVSAGLQLIGDSEDHASWVEERVAAEIAGCGAFAAVLPYRPTAVHRTSKYILREWEIALSKSMPCLVVADARIELPPDFEDRPGLLRLRDDELDTAALTDAVELLAEDWAQPARTPYVFYATDFDAGSTSLRATTKELVEAVTTLPCVLGEYVKGDVVQREILDAVRGAALVLADISGDSPNVYIELGAARAANVPVYLLRKGETRRPPFMLRDQQVWDYAQDADLLGRVVRIVHPHRRTLLNPRHI